MARSQELLQLLRSLDQAEVGVQYLIEHLQDLMADYPPYQSDEERAEAEETRKDIRRLTEQFVKIKQEPIPLKFGDAGLKALEGFVDKELLDEYFTIRLLGSVRGIVSRWGRLKALRIVLLPGAKVTQYLSQAITCYLHGLYDAAVVLCRAVLEFALREKLGTLGGVKPGSLELEHVIDFCRNARILSDELTGKAHRVRRVGNDAIHRTICSESEALAQIRETGEILESLYGSGAVGR